MTTPIGPVIAAPGQYTHCVDRTNYKAPPSTSSFSDIMSALFSSSLAATAEWLLCGNHSGPSASRHGFARPG